MKLGWLIHPPQNQNRRSHHMATIKAVGIEGRKETIKATTSDQIIKNFEGEKMHITGYITYADADEYDEDDVFISIKTKEHGYIVSTSPSVRRKVEKIVSAYPVAELNDLFTDGEHVEVIKGRAASGRDYFDLRVID